MRALKPVHVRRRARSWVLQILYAWELTEGGPLGESARRLLARRTVSERYRPYMTYLLALIEEKLPEIDAVLEGAIPNWRLERLATIDRNILRIGVAELLYSDDVPGKVAITEAIRLAEKYGSQESPRFVNGVLDAIYRERTGGG